MKLINFNTPYQLFWGSIPLLWLITLLAPIKGIDIQLHDTYFVTVFYHLAIPISIILGGIGCLYWLFRKKLMSQWMIIFHTLITILFIFAFFIINGFSSKAETAYIEGDIIGRSMPYLLLLLLFLLAQIFFVLNLLISLFEKHK